MPNEVKDERLRELIDVLEGRRFLGNTAQLKADRDCAEALTELLALRPQREDAGADGGVIDWQLAAFDTTIALAKKCGMAREGDVGLDHLIDMRMRVEAVFSAAKLGRWLGWAQAAVVASNCGPTLADMKEINRQQSEQHRVAAPQPSAPEGLREALKRALIWHEEQDEALSKQPPSSGPNGTQWARLQHREQMDEIRAALTTSSPSPPTGRDATEEGWQWQPIETAPKDGTYVIVYQDGVLEPSQTICAWDEDWGRDVNGAPGWWLCCDGKDPELSLRGPEPTHWRPLPAAPKPETAQKGGKS